MDAHGQVVRATGFEYLPILSPAMLVLPSNFGNSDPLL